MEKILVENLVKNIDGLETLAGIDMNLCPGEIVVILGPSGCGKSTLLHLIAGLIRPDRGRILIEGTDWTGRSGRIGYMQQKSLLLPFASVLDNVCLPLVLQGQTRTQARSEASKRLESFGLAGFEKYYPQQLSGGMRQRASLLRTCMFNSDILLLDEPFAALDAITRRKTALWLKDIQQFYNMSIIFVTHDIDEAFLLGKRMYVLSSRPAVVRAEIPLDISRADPVKKEEIRQQVLNILDE